MYLGYLDDSGKHSGHRNNDRQFQILATVLIKDIFFSQVEALMAIAVEQLIPDDRRDKFEEFHAAELYGGYGVFDGVDQAARFRCIDNLLSLIDKHHVPIIYGAVNLNSLKTMDWASATPMDIAFRICARGIRQFLTDNNAHDLVLLIADECDKAIKETLRSSFRQLRGKLYRSEDRLGMLAFHVHDEMYFGNSKESIGLQLADLCAYFIAKHLEGDIGCEGFYHAIEEHIVYSKMEPENKLSGAPGSVPFFKR